MKAVIRIQCLIFLLVFGVMLKIFVDNENHNDEASILLPHGQNPQQGIDYRNIGNPKSQNEEKTAENKIKMVDHMRFYKLNSEIHHSCEDANRPRSEDISWRKNTYQHVRLKFEKHPENDVFGMKFYFDDRFLAETSERHVRCIVTVHGPGHLKNAQESRPVLEWAWAMNRQPWYVLLWYKGFVNPIGVKCKLQAAAGLNRNVSNTFFFQQIVTCVVPEIGILPESASLVQDKCGHHVTTNMEVVYPQAPEIPNPRMIGVCMASFYGRLDRNHVPYFVNWMETIHKLGVSEVTINNATLQLDDKMQQAFQYYQEIGRLTLTHYPPVHETWKSPDEDDAATEAVNKITTGDCLYRNMKKYWYVLIIDIDEVPVPTYFDTYQEYIADYTRVHDNITHAHCLTVRSAFFYQELPPGNPEYAAHLPILRQTQRLRVEPIEVDGVGISKSFHNMRNVVAAGHHLTRQTHSGGGEKHLIQHFMDEREILIHHYRFSCKWKAECRDLWNQTIHDDVIPRKFGTELQDKIEDAFRHIGYTFYTE